MSRRQVVLVILLNAFLSLIISSVVVWFALTQWVSQQPSIAPLALPTGRSQVTPPKTDLLYVVQQGDSLSGIALRFGVPIADLMRANDITDPNRISVGQRLIIPAGPLAERTPTPTLTTLPFEPPTPVKTLAATPATIRILAVASAGNLTDEAIIVSNAGKDAISLTGWTLSGPTRQQYTFPAFTLRAGESVKVHSGAGEDSATDLYWGLSAALWQKGAAVLLKDRNGEVVSRFNVE